VLEKVCNMILSSSKHQADWLILEALEDERTEKGAPTLAAAERYDLIRRSLRETVRDSLGGRVKYITYGGAPMPPRLMRLFQLIGIPLLGSYGSTECGGVTLSGLGENRPGNLGRPFPNIDVRIAADAEILVRGPTVTPGYYEDPQATREVLDEDGWFHTGDLGAIEPDGSLRVVGRKKDVFYCVDGSNIYPGWIESALESDLFILQAVLLGDHRPWIAALVVPHMQSIANQLGKELPALRPAEVEQVVSASIERINAGLEEHEKIRKFLLLEAAFPENARSVTAFQKIRIDRQAIAELYLREIETIYGASSEPIRALGPTPG
jgi:long-chain acyl-CoA synthetase